MIIVEICNYVHVFISISKAGILFLYNFIILYYKILFFSLYKIILLINLCCLIECFPNSSISPKTKYFLDNNLKCYDFTLCVELVIKAKKNRQNYFFLNSYERSRLKGIKKVNEFKDGLLILIYMIKQFFVLNILQVSKGGEDF